MSPMSISSMHFRKGRWITAAIIFLGSLGLGWYLGGRPEIYWSMERERLHALIEYLPMLRVGSPLTAQTKSCRHGLDGHEAAARDAAFTVHMIGYGEDACCIDDDCGSIGQLVRSRGGLAVMIQDIESARSFGVRAVADEHGEHLADRLIVVTNADATVRGIFRNLDSRDLDAALRYSLRRPPRGPSRLAILMDRLHAWANDAPRRL